MDKYSYTLHLSLLNFMKFFSFHPSSLSRSLNMAALPSATLTGSHSLVSTVNLTSMHSVIFSRLLIRILIKMGLRTLWHSTFPTFGWGTIHLPLLSEPNHPSSLFFTYLAVPPYRPQHLKLKTWILWETVSHVLLKLRYMTSAVFPLSTHSVILR